MLTSFDRLERRVREEAHTAHEQRGRERDEQEKEKQIRMAWFKMRVVNTLSERYPEIDVVDWDMYLSVDDPEIEPKIYLNLPKHVQIHAYADPSGEVSPTWFVHGMGHTLGLALVAARFNKG